MPSAYYSEFDAAVVGVGISEVSGPLRSQEQGIEWMAGRLSNPNGSPRLGTDGQPCVGQIVESVVLLDCTLARSHGLIDADAPARTVATVGYILGTKAAAENNVRAVCGMPPLMLPWPVPQ